MLLEDMLVIDAATIYPRYNRGGSLYSLDIIDGAAEELLYLPRNPRAHRLYGMSPVEQIALTVNIALRR
jgi:hypothetical protein